jgi:leucyl/phenylalanyl-tRNA--protein transferase
MPIYMLDDEEIWFPSSHEYEFDLVAVGGILSPERVLKAYSMGIFPWYNEPEIPEWFCPEKRCIFYPEKFMPSKSLKQAAKKHQWHYTTDQCFNEVIRQCAGNGREGNTWILPDIMNCYTTLHEMGYAHSVEVWEGSEMVGGLYGLAIGNIFCGESMFSRVSNASKFAFWKLAEVTVDLEFELIDAQLENPHLMSMGAFLIDRQEYLDLLDESIKKFGIKGSWVNKH